MDVDVSNEFNFSEVHGAMRRSGLLAKYLNVLLRGSFTLHATHCGS